MFDKHNDDVRNQILKAFGCEIEKGVAQIGETRQWADGLYKKVEQGKWVKVTANKEKPVAASGMIKKISTRFNELQKEFEQARSDFESRFESKYEPGTMGYKVLFSRAWWDEASKSDFVKRIKEEQQDLADEIKEIKQAAELDKKREREKVAGKREIDAADIDDFMSDARSMFKKIDDKIPQYINAAQLMPVVTSENYYIDTETTFTSVVTGDETAKEIDDKWETMKKSGKFDFHKSPKSSSEYLVDKKTGDVYRYSDHWGRVASCSWQLDTESDSKWDIAKSNLKNFKRKNQGTYLNPEYRVKSIEAAETVLPKFKKLVTPNDNFYLTESAKKRIFNYSATIFHNLQWNAHLSIKEIEKLKEKYELI